MLIEASDSHYGKAMYALKLRLWAKEAAEDVNHQFLKVHKKEFPVFVYSGMSGIATATALTQVLNPRLQFGMIYVRKPKEKSHGKAVETNNLHAAVGKEIRFIFCDDFICEGNTCVHVFNSIQDRFLERIVMDDILVAFTENDVASVQALRHTTNQFDFISRKVEEHFDKKVMPVIRKKKKAVEKYFSTIDSEVVMCVAS